MSIQNPNGPKPGGTYSQLGLSATTLLTVAAGKTTSGNGVAGSLYNINVLVAGSAPGALYDIDTATGETVAVQICAVPNAIGVFPLTFPYSNGLLYVPGTGQTASFSFS